MGNILGGGSSGGLLSGIFGDAGGLLSFASHPLQSIMFFVGGVIMMIVVYKIILN